MQSQNRLPPGSEPIREWEGDGSVLLLRGSDLQSKCHFKDFSSGFGFNRAVILTISPRL
jgi:hypothetical protein